MDHIPNIDQIDPESARKCLIPGMIAILEAQNDVDCLPLLQELRKIKDGTEYTLEIDQMLDALSLEHPLNPIVPVVKEAFGFSVNTFKRAAEVLSRIIDQLDMNDPLRIICTKVRDELNHPSASGEIKLSHSELLQMSTEGMKGERSPTLLHHLDLVTGYFQELMEEQGLIPTDNLTGITNLDDLAISMVGLTQDEESLLRGLLSGKITSDFEIVEKEGLSE